MTITKEEALHEINVSHVTSLGKIQGDYLIFSKTATNVIEMLCNHFEQQLSDMQKRIDEYEEWYIHRNEAQKLQDKNTGYMLTHIEELKKRIDELEAPKSCEGCLYSPQVGYIDDSSACLICSRFHLISDMFTLKDKQ